MKTSEKTFHSSSAFDLRFENLRRLRICGGKEKLRQPKKSFFGFLLMMEIFRHNQQNHLLKGFYWVIERSKFALALITNFALKS